MPTIKLNILAKDIKKTNFLNSSDCAITRALARAGYPEYVHAGTDICKKNIVSNVLISKGNPTFDSLNRKVTDMYFNEVTIEDFEHELIF